MSTMPTIAVRVQRKTAEAQGIVGLELVAAGGGPLPAFTAGAHVDVHLPNGLTRPYSLCNDPAERHRYLIAVLREPASRGGSAAVHDLVAEGQVLQIGAPKNRFPLDEQATHSLLLAGGIGITPLLAMAGRLAHLGAPFDLHCCTRSPARAAFRERIAASAFAAQAHFHYDDGDAAQRLDLPALLAAPQPGRHLYVCGPKGYMDAVLAAARTAGWPEAQLHWESFGAADEAPVDGDRAFDVRLASSGRVVTVPAGRSAVQALGDAGIDIPTSCEQGICGTCFTRVLAGEPEHRDDYLTPEEQAANDCFLPCRSRAKSPLLVLDL
jgi:vanillate O-demethylase ferredoxin subunit